MMENESNEQKQPDETEALSAKKDNSSTLIIVLIVALVAALIAIAALAFAMLLRDDSGEESGSLPTAEVITATPTEVIELVPTREPPIVVPDPDEGEATATVIAPDGANIRTGPGTNYPSLGVAQQGESAEVIGVSQDGQWYAVVAPGAPHDTGWVFGELVEVGNAENVPVLPAPPPPAPPTPTATPAPDVVFTASRTEITAGETSLLSWSVDNVQAVYLYPVGANWPDFPTTGQGTREVQPFITTTYQLRVINRDGSTDLYNIEITVRNGLTGSNWNLTSYSNGQDGLIPVLPNTQITAFFDNSGRVNGSTGCNDYNGGYQAYDEVLRIGSLNTTQQSCNDDVMAQEQAFLNAMRSAAKMSIFGNQLTVRDSSGTIVLSFFRN
jgi:heat shock protein HslJ